MPKESAIAKQNFYSINVLFPPEEESQFTETEKKVIFAVVCGLTRKEIAEIYEMSPNTLNIHLDNIFGKYRVRSMAECANLATANTIRRLLKELAELEQSQQQTQKENQLLRAAIIAASAITQPIN